MTDQLPSRGRMVSRWLVVTTAAVAVAGCESMSDATLAVREHWESRNAGQVREFAAPPREMYELLSRAAGQMGYRFLRGGPAQGRFEAVSAVRAGETHGSARQLRLQADLSPTLDGTGTRLTVRLTEVIETDSSNRAGQAVEVPLRDTPQYQVLFERIAGLRAASTGGAAGQKSR